MPKAYSLGDRIESGKTTEIKRKIAVGLAGALKQIFATLRKILKDCREAGIQKTNEIRPKITSGEITV